MKVSKKRFVLPVCYSSYPIFPFFIVNIVMGLLKITTIKFYFISQIAMLPATLLYVYAGVQISDLESISDITSPELLVIFS